MMLRPIATTGLAWALATTACSGGSAAPAPAPSASAARAAPAGSTPRAAAASARSAGGARSESADTDLYAFEYSYPAAAGAIPALRDWLDADLERQRRELVARAEAQRAESRKEGYPFNPYGRWIDWKVVTDLPGWLSLSASISTYEGGAHPNHGFTALLWDRKAGRMRAPADLFVSPAALSAAIRADFCRALDRQRAHKRGAPVRRGSDEPFSDCIDPVASTVILGSAGRKAFDRIGVLVAPYEAGPYAEGEYEVTLPVTPAVLAAVRPEHRASFATVR